NPQSPCLASGLSLSPQTSLIELLQLSVSASFFEACGRQCASRRLHGLLRVGRLNTMRRSEFVDLVAIVDKLVSSRIVHPSLPGTGRGVERYCPPYTRTYVSESINLRLFAPLLSAFGLSRPLSRPWSLCGAA